jgi:hypothetical protein
LNNPHWVYERGERRVTLGAAPHVVPSGRGTVLEADTTDLDLDQAIRVHSRRPLHVLYRGAKAAERARFTDELYLNYVGGRRAWKSGQVISNFEAKVRF